MPVSIYNLVCDQLNLSVAKADGTVYRPDPTPRQARIAAHYQRWFDRSAQTAYDLDFAIHRTIHDFAGANDFPGHEQRRV